MNPIIRKTFGGMALSVYIRHFLFSSVFFVLFMMLALSADQTPLWVWGMIVINTLLYPYARFAYEGVVNYILGNHFFLADGLVFIAAKIATMLMCWTSAIFMAPLGLLYLYFYHSRQSE